MMGAWKKWIALLVLAAGIGCGAMTVQAGTIYDSPYVTFSPDGKAWTTEAGNKDTHWYVNFGPANFKTGIQSSMRSLNTGEHYYNAVRQGSLPIGEWKVEHTPASCCHSRYPEGDTFHGVPFTKEICFEYYFSAWSPYCADCGELLADVYMYMSKEAAKSIDHLEMRDDLWYFYLCPFNGNMEQACLVDKHICKAISPNRYRVEYVSNTGGEVCGGYMLPSYHMYGNAASYEGKTVTPQTRLNKNSYTRRGWSFAGWNTRADGSGDFYGDEAEIYNLCSGDYLLDKNSGTVKLYAIWEKNSSALEIDPAGGKYYNQSGITRINQGYGSSYTPNAEAVTPPPGHRVQYDTLGGTPISPEYGTKRFVEWEQVAAFKGKWEKGQYLFLASDGNADRIKAVYACNPVILPMPHKDNASFGGWYYDAQFTRPAGDAGDSIIPESDVTLYAQWVELVLTAEDNYSVNGGKGAVDLKWSQKDGQNKVYKAYQSPNGTDWEMIHYADETSDITKIEEKYSYNGRTESYTVPYSGFYELKAYGAQGGNYQTFTGGLGGAVEGRFWLDKGDVLQISVGGQDGYNGGGAGDMYANGGGCTSVSSQSRGILLVAGGGGGAAPNGDGYAGGSRQSLVPEGMNGAAGASGGGGGYLGGQAGELIVHHHVEGVCNHQHAGNPNEYGGCYKEEIVCGRTLEHNFVRSEHWYWAGYDTIFCPACGANANLGESCYGHDTNYYEHICPVHDFQEENKQEEEPATCAVIIGYEPTCGMTEEYTCGYLYDGEVISSKSAYGGSNYVNDQIAGTYTEEAGVRSGDGFFELTSVDIGYREELSMEGVKAEDKEAPRAIDPACVSKAGVGSDKVRVCWEQPEDEGTLYYHMVESYAVANAVKLCSSNITANTLVSGVKGYYYCVDESENTQVSKGNSQFTDAKQLVQTLSVRKRYLHIRVADVAGNLSATAHIPLGSLELGDPDVVWQPYTEQLILDPGENVYAKPGENLYYVKGDGATPFVMRYTAYMEGPVTAECQLNYAVFRMVETNGRQARNIISVPNCAVQDADARIDVARLRYSADGQSYLQNESYTSAIRKRRNRELSVIQNFVLDQSANGRVLEIIPEAGADHKQTTIWSDRELDAQNGLKIVGDGEPPRINGAERLEELLLIDRRNGRIKLRLSATDALSGVKEMRLMVHNLDNATESEWRCGGEGFLEADITSDEPVFSGDFTIKIYACDNVGNETTLTYQTTEFDLKAEVERMLSPHDPLFKRGESGVLHITTWGYAERVEIEFPAELLAYNGNLNHTYVYDRGQRYRQQEDYTFMIPLYAPENVQYTITVRAYKGDKMLELYPTFSVIGVNGTVLDELRTRLR